MKTDTKRTNLSIKIDYFTISTMVPPFVKMYLREDEDYSNHFRSKITQRSFHFHIFVASFYSSCVSRVERKVPLSYRETEQALAILFFLVLQKAVETFLLLYYASIFIHLRDSFECLKGQWSARFPLWTYGSGIEFIASYRARVMPEADDTDACILPPLFTTFTV